MLCRLFGIERDMQTAQHHFFAVSPEGVGNFIRPCSFKRSGSNADNIVLAVVVDRIVEVFVDKFDLMLRRGQAYQDGNFWLLSSSIFPCGEIRRIFRGLVSSGFSMYIR